MKFLLDVCLVCSQERIDLMADDRELAREILSGKITVEEAGRMRSSSAGVAVSMNQVRAGGRRCSDLGRTGIDHGYPHRSKVTWIQGQGVLHAIRLHRLRQTHVLRFESRPP